MANETTTTTANDVYFAAWVSDRLLDEIRPYMVTKPLLRYEGRRNSKAFDFPIMDDPGVATSNQAEGTAFTNTALSTSKATATAVMNGIVATVTDFLDLVAMVDVVSYFGQVLARSCAEEYEVTLTALINDGSNSTGVSGSDFTLAQFQDAVSALEQRDAIGQLVAVLHPVQVGDLRLGLGASAASLWTVPSAGAEPFTDYKGAGYAGNLFGVDIFMTSAVPTANAGADRDGGIFVKGVTDGIYEVRDIGAETHRDAFLPGTQIACTSYYGAVEIRDTWKQRIVTDA